MTGTKKYALWGFLFGSLGLFVLSGLALISKFFEVVAAPFAWPGRVVAETFVGANGSNLAVFLLALFNGALYAVVFMAIGRIFAKKPEPRQ